MTLRHLRRWLLVIGICTLVVVALRSARLPYIIAGMVRQSVTPASFAAPLAPLPATPEPQPAATITPPGSLAEMSNADIATAYVPCRTRATARQMQDRCGKMKAVIIELEETWLPLTAAALPPKPTRIPATPVGTPVPPGVIPEEYMAIEELTQIDPDPTLSYATSVWRLGAVLGEKPGYYFMFLVASPPGKDGFPLLQTFFDSAPKDVRERYAHRWLCPEPIGAITITAITSQTGIVSFTSTSGKRGTFDLARHTWSFAP